MRILIIEDEDRMRDLLRNGLREHGHTVVAAANAREGLSLARECSVDIVLLDLMLPGMDGWEAMRRLARIRLPGLGHYAYRMRRRTGRDPRIGQRRRRLPRQPFSFLELLARIGNLQRARLTPRCEMLTLDTLAFDSVRHVAYRSGRMLSLTRTEFAVLTCLFKSTGQPVSRSELVHSVWGYEQDISRGNLDSFISLLRKKIDLTGRTAAGSHG